MAQSTFDDEDLFTEASDEMRADVEESIERAREALPDADDVLEAKGDNVVGVLNGLQSKLDTGDASEHLREARKWFETGRRAEAFDEEFVEDVGGEIESVEAAVVALDEAEGSAGELRDTLAALKQLL